MVRRLVLPTALLALLTVAGCGYGEPASLTAAQRDARIALIESRPGFSDPDLAVLCPALYPRGFLRDTDRYPDARRADDDRPPRLTAQDRADASAAGCDVWP